MEDREMRFGDFIEQKRRAKAITLTGMAAKLKISPVYLCDLEKNRRYPPDDMEKLEQFALFLGLTGEERLTMLNLAGLGRDTVAPDLPEYIMNRTYVSVALRTARDLNAGEKEWMQFVEDLKRRKGEA